MRTKEQAAGILRRTVRASGFDVLRRNFYSPLPRIEEIPAATFQRRHPLTGIAWCMDRYESFLRDLEPWLREFEPPELFSWDNPMYGPVESEVLHALVRRDKPKRIVELGSGLTSLIIAAACRRNAADGSSCRYVAFDPYPRDWLRREIPGMHALHATGACDVPQDEFDALEAGDILFIDTTHTVKVGGDVNRLILEILPALQPGVLVHVHDIFLPYEYPREFLEMQCYWQEQYLLQALLIENPRFEVVFPAWAMCRERPDVVFELLPQHRGRVFGPGAFWLCRRSDSVR